MFIAKIKGTLHDGSVRHARQEVESRQGFYDFCQSVKRDFARFTATLEEVALNSEGQKQTTEIVTHTYRR